MKKDIKDRIERIEYYIKMLKLNPERFEENSNIIDLQFHMFHLGKLLKSDEHHKKRGYTTSYNLPKLN
jgi:hypothetical protein